MVTLILVIIQNMVLVLYEMFWKELIIQIISTINIKYTVSISYNNYKV